MFSDAFLVVSKHFTPGVYNNKVIIPVHTVVYPHLFCLLTDMLQPLFPNERGRCDN